MPTRRHPIPPAALDVYAFIVRHKTEHDGIAPCVREIIEHTPITSSSMVTYYLGKLEDAGRIRLLRNTSGYMAPRGIVVEGGSWQPPAVN